MTVSDYMSLPDDLPVPDDDGGADHLAETSMPHIVLPSTGGADVALDELGAGRTVVYVYPRTGKPGVDLPDGWDAIPGARGCTPEACGFRDHFAELRAAGATSVYGLSSQSTDYQAEFAQRLELPFEILSDERHQLVGALQSADLHRRRRAALQAPDDDRRRGPHRARLLPDLSARPARRRGARLALGARRGDGLISPPSRATTASARPQSEQTPARRHHPQLAGELLGHLDG